MNRLNRASGNTLAAGALAAVLAGPALAQNDPALETRVRELEQELLLLKKQMEGQTKVINERVEKSEKMITMKGPAPTFSSADGQYTMTITGRVHWDFAQFDQGNNTTIVNGVAQTQAVAASENRRDLSSGNTLRRARLGVNGKIDGDWGYEMILDAGDSESGTVQIDQIWLSYEAIKPIVFTLGRHKTPNSFDELTSSNDIPFLERSLGSNLATGPAGAKRVGFSAVGRNDWLWAGVGVFGGDWNVNDVDDQISFNGRVVVKPFATKDYGLHLGVSGYYLQNADTPQFGAVVTDTITFNDRPEIRVEGARWIQARSNFNSDQGYMLGAEVAGFYGPFWVNGEYYNFAFDQERNALFAVQPPEVSFDAYHIQAGWLITGETRGFSASRAAWAGIKPNDPLSLSTGGLGAWELALRYSVADLNDEESNFIGTTLAGVRGGKEENMTVGVNWWVNEYVAFKFNYIHADIDRRDLNNLQVGDTFNVYALRAQVKW